MQILCIVNILFPVLFLFLTIVNFFILWGILPTVPYLSSAYKKPDNGAFGQKDVQMRCKSHCWHHLNMDAINMIHVVYMLLD